MLPLMPSLNVPDPTICHLAFAFSLASSLCPSPLPGVAPFPSSPSPFTLLPP